MPDGAPPQGHLSYLLCIASTYFYVIIRCFHSTLLSYVVLLILQLRHVIDSPTFSSFVFVVKSGAKLF